MVGGCAAFFALAETAVLRAAADIDWRYETGFPRDSCACADELLTWLFLACKCHRFVVGNKHCTRHGTRCEQILQELSCPTCGAHSVVARLSCLVHCALCSRYDFCVRSASSGHVLGTMLGTMHATARKCPVFLMAACTPTLHSFFHCLDLGHVREPRRGQEQRHRRPSKQCRRRLGAVVLGSCRLTCARV